MKRPIVALVVVALLAFAALAIRAAVAPDALRAALEERLEAWIGRPVVVTGRADVRLLPSPSVRWSEATLAHPETAAFAEIDELTVRLSPTARLLGRVQIAAVDLHRPRLRLAAPDRHRLLDVEARAAALPALDLTIDDGTVDLDRGGGAVERFDAVEASLRWPPAHDRAEFELSALRHGGRFRLGVKGPSPLDLARGTPSRLAVDLTTPDLRLRWTGHLDADPTRRLTGALDLDVADPNRALAWFGIARGADLLAAGVHLEAQTRVSTTAATLTSLRLDLGGARATGVLSLRWDLAEPLLGGTLAFDALGFGGERPSGFGSGWRDVALDRDRVALGLDLRLSAGRFVLGDLVLGRAAASIHLVDGRLQADVGEITLWDRPISASLRGELRPDGLHTRVSAHAGELPATGLATLLGIPALESGAVTATFDGETACARPIDCLFAPSGRLRLAAHDLTVVGPSPFGDVTRFHPIVVAPKATPTRALWPRATAELQLTGPHVAVEQLDILTERGRFVLSGIGNLLAATLDLAGRAEFPNARADPARPASSIVAIPIRVRGTLAGFETTAGHEEAPNAAAPSEAPAPVNEPPVVNETPEPTDEQPPSEAAPSEAASDERSPAEATPGATPPGEPPPPTAAEPAPMPER